MSSIELYIMFFSFQMFKVSISMFIVSFYAFVFFILNINFHIFAILGFCSDGFINICLFSHRLIFSFWSFFGAPVSSASISSIICFLSNKLLISNSLRFEWRTWWDVLSPLFIYFLFRKRIVFPFWFDFLDWHSQSCVNVIGISNHSNTY